MNETTRERDRLQSRGTTAQQGVASQQNTGTQQNTGAQRNVELETTTTTIEKGNTAGGGAQQAAGRHDQQGGVKERAQAEAQDARQRAGQVGEQVRHSAAEAGDQMRRKSRETAELVRQQAAEQAAMIRQRAAEEARSRKDTFATKICDVGGALKRASEDLEKHDDPALASQTRRLADGIDGVGQHLRDAEVSDLLEDVEHFVRRNPTLAIGGLFVAGLSIGRFLKAQPPRYQGRSSQSGQSGDSHPRGGTSQLSSDGTNPYLQRQVGTAPEAAAGQASGFGGGPGVASAPKPASPPHIPPMDTPSASSAQGMPGAGVSGGGAPAGDATRGASSGPSSQRSDQSTPEAARKTAQEANESGQGNRPSGCSTPRPR